MSRVPQRMVNVVTSRPWALYRPSPAKAALASQERRTVSAHVSTITENSHGRLVVICGECEDDHYEAALIGIGTPVTSRQMAELPRENYATLTAATGLPSLRDLHATARLSNPVAQGSVGPPFERRHQTGCPHHPELAPMVLARPQLPHPALGVDARGVVHESQLPVTALFRTSPVLVAHRPDYFWFRSATQAPGCPEKQRDPRPYGFGLRGSGSRTRKLTTHGGCTQTWGSEPRARFSPVRIA